jgi:hypothetical protein
MLSNSADPIQSLINTLDCPEHVNLDDLRQNLVLLSARWSKLNDLAALYESELQRELRAKIELCGGIPSCPDADCALSLNGKALLSARRAATLQFNRVFHISPFLRDTPAKKNRRNPEKEVRLGAQKNL